MDLACVESRLQSQGTALLRSNSKQTSLAAQWLKLHLSHAESPSSIFFLGTKIPHTSSALPPTPAPQKEEVSQDLEKVGGAFWKRVATKKAGALGLIPERARGLG